MLVLPIVSPGHKDDKLIIVIGKGNVERMMKADPVQIPGVFPQDLINPTVAVCYEDDSPELARVMNSRDLQKIVNYLTRGFQYIPEKGDNDNGLQPLNSGN